MTPERWQQSRRAVSRGSSGRPVEGRARDFSSRRAEATRGCGHEVESLLAQPVSAEEGITGSAGERMRYKPMTRSDKSRGTGRWSGGVSVRYLFQERIGAGGMGEVYRAQDVKLRRDVAIKILPVRVHQRPRSARAVRTGSAAPGLAQSPQHRGDLRPRGTGFFHRPQGRRSCWSWSTGQAGRTPRAGPIPLPEALLIARQLADALEAAHEHGSFTATSSPRTSNPRPTARSRSSTSGSPRLWPPLVAIGSHVTHPDAGGSGRDDLGTAAYMSPEQAPGLAGRQANGYRRSGASSSRCLPVAGFRGDGDRHDGRDPRREPIWGTLPGATPPSSAGYWSAAWRRIRSGACATSATRAWTSRTGSAVVCTAAPRSPVVVRTRPRVRVQWAMAAVTLLAALIAIGAPMWYLRTAPQAQTAGFAPSETPSVAVLPFITNDDGDRYFADGITEAVTTELGRVGGLRVIASSSTFKYRDRTALRDIARDLKVGLVVGGSIQRAGGTVRIDVSLVDTRDDTVLWSERYSRELSDVLTVQDDISRQIAHTLSKTFGSKLSAKSPSPSTTSLAAFHAYSLGLWHLKGRSSNTPNMADWGDERVEAIEAARRGSGS